MSEANIPPTSGSPESAPQFPVDDSLVNDVWQDWQTVELPNSLDLEAIAPVAPVAPEPVPEPAPEPTDQLATDETQVAHLIELIQQLNECNTQLLDRVEQLEGAIEHSQVDLQTEIAHHQDVLAQAATKENALQTQLAHLMQQLEASHQASQRQQILVETLSEQLENSQERIAQLERECSIAQSRCGEQAQKIVEVETTCRDLQIRLQRQQRYTMQFKVALNKCLDVPSPCEEADREAALMPAPQALLPKVVSIRPWSAEPQFPSIDPHELPTLQRLRGESIDPLPASSPDASSLELNATVSDWIDSPAEAEPEAVDAIAPVESIDGMEPTVIETIEITADMLHEQHDQTDAPAEPDDEAALWQDLARLIEVSTEDVVRASTAEDFAEFAHQITDEPDWEPPALELPAPPQTPAAKPEPAPVSAAKLDLPIAKSNWPSPVVYPLRPPTQKRKSLAAVELPSFPR